MSSGGMVAKNKNGKKPPKPKKDDQKTSPGNHTKLRRQKSWVGHARK